MADFKSSRFARKPFNKSGGRFDGPMQKYKADCAKCGAVCEVPFRPNGKKPVFCSNCFVKDADDAPRGRREFSPRPSFDRPQRDDRSMADLKYELQGVNEKLERLLNVIEQGMSAPAPKKVKAAKKRS